MAGVNETKQRFLKLRTGEVSLVDHPANEEEWLTVKRLSAGGQMDKPTPNPELAAPPIVAAVATPPPEQPVQKTTEAPPDASVPAAAAPEQVPVPAASDVPVEQPVAKGVMELDEVPLATAVAAHQLAMTEHGELALMNGQLAMMDNDVVLVAGDLVMLYGELRMLGGEAKLLNGRTIVQGGQLVMVGGRLRRMGANTIMELTTKTLPEGVFQMVDGKPTVDMEQLGTVTKAKHFTPERASKLESALKVMIDLFTDLSPESAHATVSAALSGAPVAAQKSVSTSAFGRVEMTAGVDGVPIAIQPVQSDAPVQPPALAVDESVIAAAVTKALAPIATRLEALEGARQPPKSSDPDQTPVAKSKGDTSPWIGMFG
jgi:hypothetical protein